MKKHVNLTKTTRAAFMAKMWQLIKYQPDTTNCGNCGNAEWSEESGDCTLVSGFKFPIRKEGVCKRHTSFRF